jgi:ribosome maturation factor RimP
LVEAFERAADALPFEDEFRGVEIVARRAVRHGRTTTLTLILDKPGGVDLAFCGRVAGRLNDVLETEPDPYMLEVESAGLDRPLVRPADYTRFAGRPVRVVTTEAVDGRKTHRGTLAGVRGMSIVLTLPGGTELLLPIDAIKTANLEFDPREDLRRAKREKREAR